eukprot:3969962-Pyramimonas_sp.AAC.1
MREEGIYTYRADQSDEGRGYIPPYGLSTLYDERLVCGESHVRARARMGLTGADDPTAQVYDCTSQLKTETQRRLEVANQELLHQVDGALAALSHGFREELTKGVQLAVGFAEAKCTQEARAREQVRIAS